MHRNIFGVCCIASTHPSRPLPGASLKWCGHRIRACCRRPARLGHKHRICVGPSPHAIPDPTEPSLCRVFFWFFPSNGGERLIPSSSGRYQPLVGTNAWACRERGGHTSLFCGPRGLDRWAAMPLEANSRGRGRPQADAGGHSPERASWPSARPRARRRYSRASGRTICTRLNNVFPGSSHGIMCAECSNHTPCLNGACTRCSQRSVGAEGVV